MVKVLGQHHVQVNGTHNSGRVWRSLEEFEAKIRIGYELKAAS